MKQFLFYLTTMVFMTTGNLKAQNKSFENDAKTIDALIKASYEVVSGEKGAKREWKEIIICTIKKQYILIWTEKSKNK